MARILTVVFVTFSVLHAAWGSVLENGRATLLYWDRSVITDRTIVANKPDIVLTDRSKRQAVLVDITIPHDVNLVKAEKDKATLHAADECSGPGNLGIIGGKTASITELPSAVSVLIKTKEGFDRVCGGSIINERFILTSAVCTSQKNSTMAVRFGSTYLNYGGEVANVVEVIPHDNYQEKNMINDIALLKLGKNITFGWLAKAQLPTKGFVIIKEGSLANFTGWGGDRVGSSQSEVLREVTLAIKPQKCCNNPQFPELTDAKRICVGASAAKPYMGDGGSPLTQNGVLIGIESYKSGVEDNKPYVFTNVASYLEWIDTKIDKNP